MFYLSCIEFRASERAVRALLGNPYVLHQAMLNAWEDGTCERPLFRLEETRCGPRLLVQAPVRADWSRAFPKELVEAVEQKKVELQLQSGQRLRFRLRANPTVRRPARDPKTGEADFSRPGIRMALLKESDQLAWLERQGEVHTRPDDVLTGGFRVVDAMARGQMDQESYRRKDRRRMVHGGVLFEGILEVTDPAALMSTVQHGLGSGKGLGFGLLSLAPA
jgi:CRISPR system Cascade subunit CasE